MKKRPAAKRVTKRVPKVKQPDPLDSLRRALASLGNDELVGVIVELARGNRVIQRELESRFKVEPPAAELIANTQCALSDATDYDERQINRNFDYDYAAYKTIERNFRSLIAAGQLDAVMELALELMREGSHQVEMSDEGLMTDDIEDCLKIVGDAIKKSNLSPSKIAAWCEALRKHDCVGFIFQKELEALSKRK